MTAFHDLAARYLRQSRIVLYLHVSADGSIMDWNPAVETRLGRSAEELDGLRLEDLVAVGQARQVLSEAEDPRLVHFVDSDHRPFSLSCRVLRDGDSVHVIGEDPPAKIESLEKDFFETNQELAVLNREKTRQARELAETKKELESTLEDLETSYWHLKRVQEFLPVCMHCGRIRHDGASWDSMVEYLRKNSIFVTHGLCPECTDRHYDEYATEDEEPAS